MEAGQTFAIGGLIQTSVLASTNKVPVVGDLPFVGTLFSSINHTEQEQELVILVTPYLVDPMDCKQAPCKLPGMETRKPDDFELFLETILEAPRGQREVFPGKKYVPAYKNDATADKIPCGGDAGSGNGACGNGNCAGAANGPATAPTPPPPPPPLVQPAAPPAQ
jgi:pilus assembly protein CpaC